ncbi:MAG: F0F1 ATP synthase subunit C [Alphaproteobacteria bacterium]|nr:F0F1 ATP synthase subunit C [Alphaproteobacteria bacterium]MBQ8347076.1 F0F1 ATP synthase subunit C [Alphaproteobacteria bacterium]
MEAEYAKYIADAAKFLAAALCALSMKTAAEGVSKIWITMIDTVGRNPTVKNDVNAFGLIGFAATEAIALYALVIALIMLFL